SHPPDKLQVLQTAGEWHATFGYPGPSGPASDVVVNNFIIVDMMAKAATDQATPEEAVAWAQKEIEPIYGSGGERVGAPGRLPSPLVGEGSTRCARFRCAPISRERTLVRPRTSTWPRLPPTRSGKSSGMWWPSTASAWRRATASSWCCSGRRDAARPRCCE